MTRRVDRSRSPARGVPGDPPGRRQFATLFDRRAARARGRRRARRRSRSRTRRGGRSTPTRRNAVLVLHALTGRQPRGRAGRTRARATSAGGTRSIGPGRAIDTDQFFVVCPNVLGGCQGTTGPASIDPETGAAVRLAVPDDHDPRPGRGRGRARRRARHRALGCGRRRLDGRPARARVGGRRTRERVPHAVIIACGAAATAEQIALCSLQIRAIEADPHFHGGDYYDAEPATGRGAGLSIARGIGQVSYRIRARARRSASTAATRTTSTRSRAGSTRSSRTSSTTARSSRAASTPTPTSCCRGR